MDAREIISKLIPLARIGGDIDGRVVDEARAWLARTEPEPARGHEIEDADDLHAALIEIGAYAGRIEAENERLKLGAYEDSPAVAAMQKRIDGLIRLNQRFNADCQAVSDQRDSIAADNRRLESEVARLKAEVDHARKQRDNLGTEVDRLTRASVYPEILIGRLGFHTDSNAAQCIREHLAGRL